MASATRDGYGYAFRSPLELVDPSGTDPGPYVVYKITEGEYNSTYVGISRNFPQRNAFYRANGLEADVVVAGVDEATARGIEQTSIDVLGLKGEYGENSINSIAPNNPNRAERIKLAKDYFEENPEAVEEMFGSNREAFLQEYWVDEGLFQAAACDEAAEIFPIGLALLRGGGGEVTRE